MKKIIFSIVLCLLLVITSVSVLGVEWDITNGTPFEYDTIRGSYNSVVQIDETHYLNTYSGDILNGPGYAIILKVNGSIITNGTRYQFDATQGTYNSLVKIDSTHYLNTYAGVDLDGYAIVLTINITDLTITNGTPFEYDTIQGSYNSVVQIDETHYLNTYSGDSSDGYGVVLIVNNTDWTITRGTPIEFNINNVKYNSLVKINETHYLNAYTDQGENGKAIVFIVDNNYWNLTLGTAIEYDSDRGVFNSMVQIDDTHYLNTYQGIFSGSDYIENAIILNISGTTITKGTPLQFDSLGGWNSLVKVDSTHYLNIYGKDNTENYAIILIVNNTDWSITNNSKITLTSSYTSDNAIVKINNSNYLNVYTGVDTDGYAIVLTVDVPLTDTCTYSGSGDWLIEASDNCILSTDTSLPSNQILITGTGLVTITADIGASLVYIGTGSTVYIPTSNGGSLYTI